MDVFAYCTAPALAAVEKALDVEAYSSPPYKASTFNPALMAGRDMLYFRLHGLPAVPYQMLGEDMEGNMAPALNLEHLNGVDLGGAVVMIANCYSAESPFVPAFYRAGARAVIAAPGANFAAAGDVIGSDLLARWVKLGMEAGLSIGRALSVAKMRLLPTAWRAADRDALGFKIMEDTNP